MSATSQTTKAALRQSTRERLAQLGPEARNAASGEAQTRLQEQELWQTARSVLFYSPLPGELDLWPLAQVAQASGKLVLLPRYNAATGSYTPCHVNALERDLAVGRYGIREPREWCAAATIPLDLVLVPGVAFDLHGRRLGRGKGYYDRLLAEVRGPTCGVAFDQQIVARVPIEPHDIVVNCILTPSQWIVVRAGSVLE